MEIEEVTVVKKIILFDGVCNLCNRMVNYVIERDKKDDFRFVSLQSETGISILKKIGLYGNNIDSIVLYEPGVAYFYKANAALEIAKSLGGIYSILGYVLNILPDSILNFGYDFIAKNRYKWFGKQDACMIPTAELQSKFLD
ncbi:thiol-disulfide oxidoreductase DCC family protein [Flavobacterium ardleyense]|uniref:thiol-disulfide oxidoreductase DCC family protein n=1 Tax=Flavobacterium ardleyense TaxID=2038737 RepID=UPI00298CDA61|nr:DCC1-like thiol-disulfide oxidoreductase family protein [Flavobacterium ardleyense]